MYVHPSINAQPQFYQQINCSLCSLQLTSPSCNKPLFRPEHLRRQFSRGSREYFYTTPEIVIRTLFQKSLMGIHRQTNGKSKKRRTFRVLLNPDNDYVLCFGEWRHSNCWQPTDVAYLMRWRSAQRRRANVYLPRGQSRLTCNCNGLFSSYI